MLRASTSPRTAQVLATSAVAVSCAADTTENTLATITIPANTLGPHGRIRVVTVWSCTNSANNKTVFTRFGGSIIGQVTLTTSVSYREERVVQNRGAAGSQLGFISAFGGAGTSSIAVVNLTVDTTANQNIVIAGQKAVAGETLTLESYLVEVLP